MAMVPGHAVELEAEFAARRRPRAMAWWVRGILLAIVLAWVGVFLIATRINPYRDDRVWLEATHTQLGLPPCTFKTMSGGLPCPSCGMTTSFALFMRGDVWHSVQANFVGTGLAIFGMIFIIWGIVSAVRGKLWGIRSVEMTLIRLTIAFVVVLFARWGIVLGLHYWGGGT